MLHVVPGGRVNYLTSFIIAFAVRSNSAISRRKPTASAA
jgi:hypothetical protein